MADKNNENIIPEEVNENLIELIDENGESTVFEHLDTVELNGKTYFALTEFVEEEHEEDDIYIMKVVTDENGEETLELLEDKKEIKEVYDIVVEHLKDEYEFLEEI